MRTSFITIFSKCDVSHGRLFDGPNSWDKAASCSSAGLTHEGIYVRQLRWVWNWIGPPSWADLYWAVWPTFKFTPKSLLSDTELGFDVKIYDRPKESSVQKISSLFKMLCGERKNLIRNWVKVSGLWNIRIKCLFQHRYVTSDREVKPIGVLNCCNKTETIFK